MKRIALCFAFGTSLLTGCAGLRTDSTPSYVVDDQRIQAIERAASRSGVGVIWVNQPMKRAVAGG